MPTRRTNDLKKRLLVGGSWAFSGKVLTVLMSLASYAIMARLLNPKDMGMYFVALSVVFFFSMVAQMGLEMSLVRVVAESVSSDSYGKVYEAVRNAFVSAAISCAVIGVLLLSGLGQWIFEGIFNFTALGMSLGAIAVWIVAVTFQNLAAETFRGFYDIKSAAVHGGLLTASLLTVVLGIVWVVGGEPTLREVIVLSICAFAVNVFIACARLLPRMKPYAKGKGRGEGDILRMSWQYWVNNLLLYLMMNSGVWIMGAYRSPEEVAVYGAASKMVMFMVLPLLVVNSTISPIVAEMNVKGELKKIEKVLRSTALLAGVPAFVILAVNTILNEEVMTVTYGDFYAEGGIVLAILSVGMFLVVWAGPCGITLLMAGKQKAMMIVTAISGSVGIGVSMLCVRGHGTVGVAVGVAAGWIVQSVLLLLAAKRTLGVWTHISTTREDLMYILCHVKGLIARK